MIRVFIADDHAIVRAGLKGILADVPGLRWCGEASNADEIREKVPLLRPDVVVLDVRLPGASGTGLVRELRALPSPPGVVMFTMYAEDSHAVPFLQAGAGAYLSKSRPTRELITAIREVATTGRYITPELAEHVFVNQISLDGLPHERLSEREMHVLRELAHGRRSTEIATALGVSVSTVNTFVQRVKTKLGVNTLVELARYAHDNGLVG